MKIVILMLNQLKIMVEVQQWKVILVHLKMRSKKLVILTRWLRTLILTTLFRKKINKREIMANHTTWNQLTLWNHLIFQSRIMILRATEHPLISEMNPEENAFLTLLLAFSLKMNLVWLPLIVTLIRLKRQLGT